MFIHTGDYVKHMGADILRSTYYTFTPRPLMGNTFFIMDDSLAALLAEAHRTLGTLEGMAWGISDKESFLNLTLLMESCFSRMIDYTDSDILSLLAEPTAKNSDNHIQNIISAYRYAINTNMTSFDRIASCAIAGDDTNTKITARSKPLFLTQATANYRQYNPTAPENIRSALDDIQEYLKSDDADILIRAALCHYQFEMIHPYEYYNGVIGRILIHHMLSNAGLKCANLLCLSHSLYHHKSEYFDKLGAAQKDGNYLAWIDFFVSAVKEAAQNSIEILQRYEELTKRDAAKTGTRHRGKAGYQSDIYLYFKRNIVSTVGQVSQQLGLAYSTVARSVDNLCDLDILKQISSGSRNRIFAYDEMLKLISE